jgi:predicted nucleotidyltransferase
MRREQTLEGIRRTEAELRAMGVESAALFGSVARGDDGEFSDIDIAVRPAEGRVLDAMAVLALYGVFGDEFGYDTAIDVVVLPTRNPELSAAIERDAVVAFS